jgi:ribonucleoside-diphosphate reductase alpha chain
MAKKPAVTVFVDEYKSLREVNEISISDNAKEIFKRRYLLKDKDGKVNETLDEAFYRVASHMGDAEKNKALKELYTDAFYKMMTDLRFVPNSPTWTGAKTPLGQLAACFVLPLEDNMGSEEGGIFDTLKNAALIQQTGGGNGFSFSRLRPKGARVNSSNGIASGPISFLQAYDTAFGKISQGGTRRGANMGVLRVDHPDIREFIKCKSEEGSISNFNISVGVTDKFMQALKADTEYELINPADNTVWEKVKAKEIFDEIVKYAYKNGEPGVLFVDVANRENPVPNQYVLEATNPCGEQWLGPYENCCLGHVNINASVKNGKLDWNHLRETIILGTRFLDNVVTQNKYVPSVPKLKEAAYKNRRIGLGFLGLADAMYQLGIRYGSEQSFEFASQVTEFIRYNSMLASIALAEEKGAFPGIKGSRYDSNDLKWTIPQSLVPHENDFGRPKLDWNKVEKLLRTYGIRNATQLTVAPTGTTGTVFDVEGYGCEPVFALAYYRNVFQAAGGEGDLQLAYVSPSFRRALNSTDLSDEAKDSIIKEVINKGSLQNIPNIPTKIKDVFVVSSDITADEHVMMQAAIQRFVDNSISKTCNFPETATIEDVKQAYIKAWDLGCKGLTVYVTGSRDVVVLETKETKDKKAGISEIEETADVTVSQSAPPEYVSTFEKRPRPLVVNGRTHEVHTPFGTAYVTVNRNGETGTKPFEVFVTIGKSGSDAAAFAEALGRLISGWLRSAHSPDNAMEEIAYQLKGIGGSSSVGFGTNRVGSIPDAVAKVLFREMEFSQTLKNKPAELENNVNNDQPDKSETLSFIGQGVFKNASVCPECHNMTLVETEGCIKCHSCAYSKC